MFIISAIDKDCKLLDFDVVNEKTLDITVAKYKTKGYEAFDIEELDEKYDYLQDDLEVLG
jgi:HKD family nuclease